MKVSRSALLPYSANRVFDVVADIPAYSEFLPWCAESTILREEGDTVQAQLQVRYLGAQLRFSTQNVNKKGESITMTLIEGPFKFLSGQWHFIALDENACKVSLEMDFDFDNSLAKRITQKVFTNIITSQLESFIARSHSLYGESNA